MIELYKSYDNNPILIHPDRGMPRSIAVIGAGTIGPDIGYYLKSEVPDLALVLIDIREDALNRALERIASYRDKGVNNGKLTTQQAENITKRVMTSTDYNAISACDWVIEAATENLALKHRIFAQVEAIVGRETLITSNTSSLPAARLFTGLKHPERATVTHFFAPAFRNPAVEVIAWERVDRCVIDYLRWFFCRTGKVPIMTADVVCFMLDRIFDNWCNEAGFLLQHATAAQIDSVAMDYVHAGPFYVLNIANGNPIIIETNSLQAEAEGTHYRPAEAFKTTGKWETLPLNRREKVDRETAAKIQERLLGVLFSQSVDILDRDIGTPADLELGCRIALGFKQGPLALMRDLGERKVNDIINRFSAIKPGMPRPAKPLQSYQTFFRFILVDDISGVKLITLRRPEALNALHDEMTDEILNLIKHYEDDPGTKGFIISGYGPRAFSAGADIGRFPELLGNRDESAEYARACSRLLIHLDSCNKPVVAALNGMALGGGLELAIRCHGLVAVKSAWLQFPEIGLGIVPGIGALVIPYRRWPSASSIFHGLLTKAERLPVAAAHAIGMINKLVGDPADLIPAAVQLVDELVKQKHTITTGAVEIAPIDISHATAADGRPLSKQILNIMCNAIKGAAAKETLTEALEVGYGAFGESACTAAAREGITAFQERRRPDFNKTG